MDDLDIIDLRANRKYTTFSAPCFMAFALFFAELCFCQYGVAETNDIHGSAPIAMSTDASINQAVRGLSEHWSNSYKDGEVTMVFQPGSRSVRDILTGQIDFHYPAICDFYEDNPKVKTVSIPVEDVPFGIYSRGDKPVYAADLKDVTYQFRPAALTELREAFTADEAAKLKSMTQPFPNRDALISAAEATLDRPLNHTEARLIERVAFPYVISTAALYVPYMEVPTYPSVSLPNGINTLFRKRIDAYITVPAAGESLIKTFHKDEKVERDLYAMRNMCFLVQNSERGEKIGKILLQLYQNTFDDGTYKRLFGPVVKANEDWVAKYKK